MTATGQIPLVTAPLPRIATGKRRAAAPLWWAHYVFAWFVHVPAMAVWFVRSYEGRVTGPHLLVFGSAFLLLFGALVALMLRQVGLL